MAKMIYPDETKITPVSYDRHDQPSEVDVLVHCEGCRRSFYIYIPDTWHECECGRTYRARLIIEKAQNRL